MSELYRVCVVGGYITPHSTSAYEAEAIVYTYGGRTVARFVACSPSHLSTRGGSIWSVVQKLRVVVERQAHAWIEAHDGS
jgi:hypothetical protein